MARPTDASSDAGDNDWDASDDYWDAGDDYWKDREDEESPSHAMASALADDPMHRPERSKPVDEDDVGDEVPARLEAEDLDEGAAERAELATFLEKLPRADNRVFTPDEQVTIMRGIEALHAEVHAEVRELKLNLHQQEAIYQLLSEVQRGSERMGRKDWITYAIGVATSLVIMEIVPPLVLFRLAVSAVHAFGHLLILNV